MYVGLHDAQTVAFEGADLVSAVVVDGRPSALPTGLAVMTNGQIDRASLQQMATAESSINNSKLFMWAIAAVIVASLVYVTALERTRDFAVLKALGASSGALYVGLALQAVVVALVAAAVAAVVAQFMVGVFAQVVAIPTSAYIILPVIGRDRGDAVEPDRPAARGGGGSGQGVRGLKGDGSWETSRSAT